MKKPHSRQSLEVSSASAIEHLLTHRPDRIRELLIGRRAHGHSRRLKALEARARGAGIPVHFVEDSREGEEAVRANLPPFVYTDFKELLGRLREGERGLVLALDHLQDPQNFGALCRTAEGLGAKAVLVPKDRSVTVTAGVYHASVGAVETLPVVQVTNLTEAIRRLKEAGFWAVGTTLGEGATDPWAMPDFERVVLILGAELEGIHAGVEKECDWKVRIPLAGRIQSLNVSAAGAVLMYEWFRRGKSLPAKQNSP